jgi:Rad3-related DNA helicase
METHTTQISLTLLSQGIDFADEKCRAVVITGLPFAPYLDPKVKLKRVRFC